MKSYTDARDYATRRAEAEHVAFITHELRNPLTTALLAASELTGPEDENRRRELLLRNLRKIEDSSKASSSPSAFRRERWPPRSPTSH